MIELKDGLYIVQGDRYKIIARDSTKVVQGETIATRKIRGNYRHAEDDITGIVKELECGTLVLSPATRRSTYAVDFGHVYEVTKELKEVRIQIKNIETIVGLESRENGTN